MGYAKNEMIKEDYRREVAIKIAIEAGLLNRCEYHDDAIFRGDNDDITDAYKLGNSKFSKGELTDIFDNRTQMTDAIKDAVKDNSHMDGCPYAPCTMDED